MINRRVIRKRIHKRIRKKIVGTSARPRLSVCFTGRHVYAQLIDDHSGHTVVSAATTEKGFRVQGEPHANKIIAEKIGKVIAERASAKSITLVVFDRGGFQYHGKVKSLADAARVGGLVF